MVKYLVSSVDFGETGVTFHYMRADDVRAGGSLSAMHALTFEGDSPARGAACASLLGVVTDFLSEALEDFEEAEPVTEADMLDVEAEERGMGFG